MDQKVSNKPLVSIITPNFNTPKEKLRRTIQSVINQTYGLWEYIVVDDGSEIAFAGLNGEISDSRIKWIKFTKNQGVAAARNSGLMLCKGEFIAFLDAGDWWDERKIELQLDKFSKNINIMWLYCDTYLYYNYKHNNIFIRKKACNKGNIFYKILNNQVIVGSSSSVILKKSVLDKIGFFSEENIIEDWDMWIRISSIYAVDFVSEALVYLDSSYNFGRSKDLEKKLLRRINLIVKYMDILENYGLLEKAISNYWILASRLYQYEGNQISSFRCALKGFKYDLSPASIKRLCSALLFLIIPIRNPLFLHKMTFLRFYFEK